MASLQAKLQLLRGIRIGGSTRLEQGLDPLFAEGPRIERTDCSHLTGRIWLFSSALSTRVQLGSDRSSLSKAAGIRPTAPLFLDARNRSI
jgi:hypothetical protein